MKLKQKQMEERKQALVKEKRRQEMKADDGKKGKVHRWRDGQERLEGGKRGERIRRR